MFYRDAQQILNITTFELLHTQNANKADILQYCIVFTNTLLFFEIILTIHNLKEGFQTYTVRRIFIPKNIIQHDPLLKEIKQVTIFIIYFHFYFLYKILIVLSTK